MSICHVQASATIELYFYGELSVRERDAVERHLTGCAECRRALEELTLIRTALESRPQVDAPPGGDWSAFMLRLQQATQALPAPNVESGALVAFRPRRPLVAVLAIAAAILLITTSVLMVGRQREASVRTPPDVAAAAPEAARSLPPARVEGATTDSALAQVSGQHFERSKLVVLGLATKDPSASPVDWDYERTLAASLLSDTRLYRLAAEERGMKTLAGVMRDLELVLLQTSMSESPGAESLAQLQHLIRRRDLLTKMEVVGTTGLLP